MGHTTREYSAFEQAYDYFNDSLFNGELPSCLITLQRKARCYGYFYRESFSARLNDSMVTDEIALNPDTFENRSDMEILSTLVHEMVHLWQCHRGKRISRKAYHNAEWAGKMEQIGLMPTDTGEPGGKRTGQKMTHYVIDGGPFLVEAQKLIGSGFKLTWQCRSADASARRKQPRSKMKYSCPECGQNAWAKPDAKLMCGECEQMMECEAEENED